MKKRFYFYSHDHIDLLMKMAHFLHTKYQNIEVIESETKTTKGAFPYIGRLTLFI